MADKEFRVRHDDPELRDPQRITALNERLWAERGMDIHRHEVADIIDDFDSKERIYKVRKRVYVVL